MDQRQTIIRLPIVAMLFAACTGQFGAPTQGTSSPASPSPSAVASAMPVGSDAAEVACRERVVAETQVDLGRVLTVDERAAIAPVLRASSALATFVLFSNGAHEYSCFAYPDQYAPTGFGLMTTSSPDHTPDRLDSTHLAIVIGSGYTSDIEFAGWLWGVASPGITELTVTTREGATGTVGEAGHTSLQNGYFFSIFDGPCCVGGFVTIVGFDSSGSEVFRSPAG